MANLEKYYGEDQRILLQHCYRANTHYSNECLDPDRSNLNYELSDHHTSKEALAFVSEQIKHNYHRNFSKTALMCSWVITAPRDLKEEDQERFLVP